MSATETTSWSNSLLPCVVCEFLGGKRSLCERQNAVLGESSYFLNAISVSETTAGQVKEELAAKIAKAASNFL